MPTPVSSTKAFFTTKRIIVISLVMVLILFSAIAHSLISQGVKVKVPTISKTKIQKEPEVSVVPLNNENTQQPNPELVSLIKEKSFEEIRSLTGGKVDAPNLYQPGLKEELDKTTGNRLPVNYTVKYEKDGFSPSTIAIVQGDMVTFENKSDFGLTIIGEGWESGFEINNKEENKFTQQFDLLGKYFYHSELFPNQKGEIVVVKAP